MSFDHFSEALLELAHFKASLSIVFLIYSCLSKGILFGSISSFKNSSLFINAESQISSFS